jgi:hypothetical protein
MVTALPQFPQRTHQPSFLHFADISPAASPSHANTTAANTTPSPSHAANNNTFYNNSAPMIRSYSDFQFNASSFDQPYAAKAEPIIPPPPPSFGYSGSYGFDNSSLPTTHAPLPPMTSSSSGTYSYPAISPPSLSNQVSNGAYPYNYVDPALALVTPTRSVSFMHSMIGEDSQDDHSNGQSALSTTALNGSSVPFGPMAVSIPPALIPNGESAPRGSLNRFLPEDQTNADGSRRTRRKRARGGDALPLYPIVPHLSEYPDFPSDGDFDEEDVDGVEDDEASSLYDTRGLKRVKASIGPGSVVSTGSGGAHRVKHSDSDGDGDSVNSHGSLSKRDKSGRHVSPAIKLAGSEENTNIHTTVTQMYYRHEGKNHRVRLIRVRNEQNNTDDVYAHGADVGSVVERKSNISRLFGKFKSPQEKLLMNVPGPHNHTVGQESNILTVAGLHTFLNTNKMKGQAHYAHWIVNDLIPKLQNPSSTDQLDVETDDRVKRSVSTAVAASKSASAPARRTSPSAVPNTAVSIPTQQPHRNGRGRLLAPYSPVASEASSLPSSPQSYASISTLGSAR